MKGIYEMDWRRTMLRPLWLLFGVVAADQLLKAIIVAKVPLFYETGYILEVWGDFFRIIHVRNLGIVFSIGNNLPLLIRKILFVMLPVIVLLFCFFTLYLSNSITKLQRWCFSAILGGGLGNIIDRLFRENGVVDFLDFRFYGLFGMERWPTFNIADSCIVIGGIMVIVTNFWGQHKNHG